MNSTYRLAPGFLVSLSEVRNVIRLPQIRGKSRRLTPARFAFIDALNHGFNGSVDACVEQIADAFDVSPVGLREFWNELHAGELVREGEFTPLERSAPPVERRKMLGEVAVAAPAIFVASGGEYLWYNHPGELRLVLTLREMFAASALVQPATLEDAWKSYQEKKPLDSLDRHEFDDLVSRLAGAGLLVNRSGKEEPDDTPLWATVNSKSVQQMVDARLAVHDEQVVNSGKSLVPVIPVNTLAGMAPQSLGVIVAYAMEYEGGRLRDRYDFLPMFLTDEERLLDRAATPSIILFSNYVWNVEKNLKMSAAVKAVNPANITVHGGPSTPKYRKDSEVFFRDNPHVDVAVLGEGELTFAEMLDRLDPSSPGSLKRIHEVAGLQVRHENGMVQTPDRERIADVNSIPSPFLMGLFEEFGSARAAAIIETNRGCPYGCTFCDWGSATLSKVRKFDLDRVFAELEWCSKHQIEDASIADANFGMLDRDVAVTEKIAELKKEYGYPRTVSINYAKNQVRYLRQIIEIMSEAEILAEGVVSLQSMDETTLKVIDRSNIKLDKYNELATEFRKARLPLAADIMMGLPGATPEAFLSDLQKCTDRDIRVRANPTQLLPNSPMNDPQYREKHGIVARPGEFLQETASYSRDEWDQMDGLRLIYYLLDSYGILRYVARYVRGETGMGEVKFYDEVRQETATHPADWPVLSNTLNMLEGYMAPPGSWWLFIDEMRRFLAAKIGLPEDSAMRTALAVQHAHLPSAARQFPEELHLEHDYVAWQEAVLAKREQGFREDWHRHVPRLSEFGPTILTIEDPNEICLRDVGKPKYLLDFNLRTWELHSPVARPRLGAASSG